MTQTIDILSLKDFTQGTPEARECFVQALGNALQDIGFFALVDHGIDQNLIDDCYAVAEKFFSLSENSKQNYELGIGGQRGFTSFGREHAKDHKAPDLKEFWHVGRELPANYVAKEAFPKNVWPSEIPEFKTCRPRYRF